jgi:cleavage and polyadenylation specificity factor subunit 3
LDKIKLIDYHQEITTKDIKFWAYNAENDIGAAMFLVEIQDIRVLYTGDFSRELDRHLQPAEIPKFDVHILIIKSTYGIHKHEPREKREYDFKKYVHEIVKKGGKCLLPVFAVGGAQKLLLILDEYWEENKSLQNIPLYITRVHWQATVLIYLRHIST